MLQCKILLALAGLPWHIVQRSIAVRRNVCFLDVSSLNLAALQSAATFFALPPVRLGAIATAPGQPGLCPTG